MNLRNFFRALLGIQHTEVRILMALEDATARLEQAVANLGNDVTTQLTAISNEIQQLATAAGNGDTAGLEARLNAVADKIDALSTQVTDSTTQLQADDPAPADGGAGDGSTDTGTQQ